MTGELDTSLQVFVVQLSEESKSHGNVYPFFDEQRQYLLCLEGLLSLCYYGQYIDEILHEYETWKRVASFINVVRMTRCG